jgi:hypothetical protein
MGTGMSNVSRRRSHNGPPQTTKEHRNTLNQKHLATLSPLHALRSRAAKQKGYVSILDYTAIAANILLSAILQYFDETCALKEGRDN